MDLQLPAHPVADRVAVFGALQPLQNLTCAGLDGPGCIKHMWVCVGANSLRRTTRYASRKAILRIHFDDELVPHVEAPVGDFFGVMHGQDWYPINNHYLSVQAWNGYICYFPMPFARSARVEIENGRERSHPLSALIWLTGSA